MLLLYSLSITLGQFSLWHWKKNITPSYIVHVLYLTLWLVEKTRAAFPLNQSPLIATFSFTVSRASRSNFFIYGFARFQKFVCFNSISLRPLVILAFVFIDLIASFTSFDQINLIEVC